MTTVITTPTGNIGRRLTELLLDAGLPLRLLARDASRVQPFADRGAEVAVGSLDDAHFVVEATREVRQLFWLTPPDVTAVDFRARQSEFGEVAAHAVRENSIERVVHLSGLGAQCAEGNGPIGGLHHNERRLDAVARDILHLRPAYFMENLLAMAPMIASQQVLAQPMPSTARLSMVATRDVAEVASAELLDDGWSGRRVREIHGPSDLSWDDVAMTISKALGSPVTYMQVPPDEVAQALSRVGISPQTASCFVEMLESLGAGRIVAAEARDASNTTATTLEEFVSDTLYPAVAALGASPP